MTFLLCYACLTLVLFLFTLALYTDQKDPIQKVLVEAGTYAVCWPVCLTIVLTHWADARGLLKSPRAAIGPGDLSPSHGR